MKKVISCCRYFRFRPDSGGDVRISSFLQPFSGGPGQGVPCELNKVILA